MLHDTFNHVLWNAFCYVTWFMSFTWHPVHFINGQWHFRLARDTITVMVLWLLLVTTVSLAITQLVSLWLMVLYVGLLQMPLQGYISKNITWKSILCLWQCNQLVAGCLWLLSHVFTSYCDILRVIIHNFHLYVFMSICSCCITCVPPWSVPPNCIVFKLDFLFYFQRTQKKHAYVYC